MSNQLQLVSLRALLTALSTSFVVVAGCSNSDTTPASSVTATVGATASSGTGSPTASASSTTSSASSTSGATGAGGADAGTPTATASSTGGTGGVGGVGGGNSNAGGAGGSGGATVQRNVVYVESNDPTATTSNAVLAFLRGADGSLSPLTPFATFPTGGSGISNPTQALGPEDSDQQVVVTPDHKYLFAVNGGSNTVAAFNIGSDGALSPVAGSPFPSGGVNPVSLGLAGSTLYVVNKAVDKLEAPTYVAMKIGADGALTAIAGAVMTAPVGASPAQALISADHKHLFGADFMGPLAVPPEGSIRSFLLDATGAITVGAGDPVALPDDATVDPVKMPPFALGLALHPTQSILYVAYVTRAKIGVYTYDATGKLTYVTAAADSGMAPCWLTPSLDGSRFYAVNTGDATVSTFDASNAVNPVESQKFSLLASTGTAFVDAAGVMQTVTSAPFEETLSPDGKYLYVVAQRVTTTATDLTSPGNQLHVLSVGATGTLSETTPPITLSVSVLARPQGIAAITLP